MSRIVHISVKDDPVLLSLLKLKAGRFIKQIQPSNIVTNKEIILEEYNSYTGIANPTGVVKCSGSNVLIGLCFPDSQDWQKTGEMPDGNYVIKRENDSSIEFVTDYQATKSLWYYHDDKFFIVSSSQRMIIYLLGDFVLNTQAVLWMISSGTIGYGNSWDMRIKSIPSSAILSLDKEKWEIKLKSEPVSYRSNRLTLKANIRLFDNIINLVFSNLQIEESKSIMSLTGGFDSRTNLLFLKEKYPEIRLMTFGIKTTIENRYSDLYVAKKLAARYNLRWTMYDTSLDYYDLEEFFNSFVSIGEARIDMIDREIDNFNWKADVFNSGYDILINGMDGLSSQHPYSNQRLNLQLRKLFHLHDYENIPKYFIILGEQIIHEDLFRRENETWPQFYHRINQIFFNPYADSSLNEILNAYVDTINPLLSKSIINFEREVPDDQRIRKIIAKKLVYSKDDSGIPFNDKTSVYPHYSVIKLERYSEYFSKYLLDFNNDFFPQSTLFEVINKTKNYLDLNELNWKVSHGDSMKSLKIRIRKTFPSLAHFYTLEKKRRKKLFMDYHILKFRMFLILKMINIIRNDLLRN